MKIENKNDIQLLRKEPNGQEQEPSGHRSVKIKGRS